VVDEQSIAARSEQLGEADARRPTVGAEAVEDIVLLEPAARRQLPALLGHGLHLPPQLDLPLEQTIAGGAVVGGVIGEMH
jgi:hypothetical protein